MRESDKSFGQLRKDQSFGQIEKDQMARESELYSTLMSGVADSDVRRNELLFKLTNDIEDAKNKLKQAEQLTDRLRKRVAELEGMYRILTKK